MEIRSYTWNGASWEWNGDGWEAEQFSTAGDFSAYKDGEQIRLVGYNEADEAVEEFVGVVRDGRPV